MDNIPPYEDDWEKDRLRDAGGDILACPNCERSEWYLRRAQVPFLYTGFNSRVQRGKSLRATTRTPVKVAKVHGSCNFAPARHVLIGAARRDGEIGERLTYPRQLHVTGYDGPMRVLPDQELNTIRSVADLVLPGEWNRFRRYIGWVGRALTAFANAASEADILLVVGFRMAAPDQVELELATKKMWSIRAVHVVDPNPSPKLLDLLHGVSGELVIHRDSIPPEL